MVSIMAMRTVIPMDTKPVIPMGKAMDMRVDSWMVQKQDMQKDMQTAKQVIDML